MKPIARTDVMNLGAYESTRVHFRNRIIALKKRRRVAVGAHMTLVFENRDTVLWQIQEMVRTERIVSESAVQHEIDTYNDLIPAEGELSATLFIEYEDPEERHRALDALVGLQTHVHLCIGTLRATARFRALPGEEEDRMPPVNYLLFPIGKEALPVLRSTAAPSSPARVEVTHPFYAARTELEEATRQELASDLST